MMMRAARGDTMFFRSKNLFLRPIWPEDLVALRAAIGESNFSRIAAAAPANLPQGNPGDRHHLPCCVIARPDANGEQIIGAAGLFLRGEDVVFELWIDPAHRGRGYGTEATRAMAELAWAAGHEKISASIPPDNVAIPRVLRKSGFQPDRNIFFSADATAVLVIAHDHDWAWTGPEMHAA
jgi:RimJ/RimL family protein N-acetyltransferase